jgi:membrane-bound lytic murein transglycosylase F
MTLDLNKLKIFRYVSLFFMLILLACSDQSLPVKKAVPIDLIQLKKKGVLTMLTENSSTSYFIYRQKELGFEYELLADFAKHIGLKLQVKVVSDAKKFHAFLQDGEGDIIACNYAITRERQRIHSFSNPYLKTHQVLVQQKPNGWEQMTKEEIQKQLISDPVQLKNRTVYVRRQSAYYKRLVNLQEEIGDTIYCKELPGDPVTEDYINAVSSGAIPLTIAEENIARISAKENPQIDVSTAISFTQSIAFGIRKTSPQLKRAIDAWLANYIKSTRFKELVSRYFGSDVFKVEPEPSNDMTEPAAGVLSPYDSYFKASAKKHGEDWLLLAAIAHKESRFNPNAVGLGGAYGMMQFMPISGPQYKVFPNSSAEEQIQGGMKMMKELLQKYAKVPKREDQIKFALASYNAGYCHIEDAMKLAGKNELNPYLWTGNVEVMLRNLSKPAYYRDAAAQCGAYRGHAADYANTVFAQYMKWKEQLNQ